MSVYDEHMAEIARQRQAEREGLDRIAESTQTIERGMADPINWLLCAGAIIGIPFTGGVSLALGIIALLRATAGGRANIQAIQPTTADLASPGLGCARILSALGVLIILVVLVLLLLATIAYNVQGGI